MKLLYSGIYAILFFFSGHAVAQVNCTKFSESPRGEEGLDAYSIYVQAIKSEDWKLAKEQWKIAYEIAPAADGKRDHNFTKGADILIHYYGKEEDKAKKKELLDQINQLYADCAECYRQKVIAIKGCNNDACIQEKIGHLKGDLGYKMYYHLRAPYSKNLQVFDEGVALTKKKTSYAVLAPYAAIAAYQYEKGKIDKAKAIAIYETLESIKDHAHETNNEYVAYYDQAWQNVENAYRPIESDLFDCEFFIEKYKPQYEEDPENPELIKRIIAKLKSEDCPLTNTFLSELDRKWKVYAAEENARIQAEFEANNPGVAAKRLYDEGKYDEAIEKYMEAMEAEADPEKQASYWFSIASIQFRKQKRYSTARESAYEAAKLRPDWGRPYMLIGDMYGTTARNCGDDWNQRMAILAAIEKYSRARSLDPEVAEEASNKISRYYAAKPDKTEGHMRSVKAGQKEKVGCWIGETVTVSFK